ncbi:PEP-CTERM sorting domain-containing protein [Ruficoccus sp. ZRK36]|uniref:PEP-CTERM sorting domain-containing protein n=1 Tax=Ruficoccus sp. ZRK36 TaxID=2866311 RepID=UPI001C737851|nr:PEP-CTERM sorting domain-containing protein [Ruficoccus sp. ZRK36]QYY37141.1 PEP-CTERM sorting domain-containing protein [Ruficoccus sp. ZRK36]
MKTFFTLPIAVASLLTLATTASAATLATWTAPESTTPASPGYTINDGVLPANSPFTYSTNTSTWFARGDSSDLVNVYNQGWTVAQQQDAAIAAESYIEFSLTADENYQFDVTDISANIAAQSLAYTATEAMDVYAFIRTSVDDYATTVGDATLNLPASPQDSTATRSGTVTATSLDPEYSSITGTVTYRIYYYIDTAAVSTNQVLRLYSTTIEGTTSVIPEPATMGLFGGAFALAMMLWVRRRR